MSETLLFTAVVEGREPLDGQTVTRQSHFKNKIVAMGGRIVFVDNANGSEHYDQFGRLSGLTPGEYAWRLRDVVWEGGDPAAYQAGDGYNTQEARELNTRTGFTDALERLGLKEFGIETKVAADLTDWQPGEFVFLKPNTISDIHDPEKSPGTRAQLVRSDQLAQKLAEPFAGGVVLQHPEKLMSARNVVDQLGLSVDTLNPGANYLHAIRVFAPLWLPVSQTPAVELRLTNPGRNGEPGDIGKPFATKRELLESDIVFGQLPAVAKLHRRAHKALAEEYGENNYFTFDYAVLSDGSVKIVNALVRAMTPNLEPQPEEVKHLAYATADVEVKWLANKAISLAGR